MKVVLPQDTIQTQTKMTVVKLPISQGRKLAKQISDDPKKVNKKIETNLSQDFWPEVLTQAVVSNYEDTEKQTSLPKKMTSSLIHVHKVMDQRPENSLSQPMQISMANEEDRTAVDSNEPA